MVLNLFSKRPKQRKIKCVKFCYPYVFRLGLPCFWERKKRKTELFSCQFENCVVKNKKKRFSLQNRLISVGSISLLYYITWQISGYEVRQKIGLFFKNPQIWAVIFYPCFLQIFLFHDVDKIRTSDSKKSLGHPKIENHGCRRKDPYCEFIEV